MNLTKKFDKAIAFIKKDIKISTSYKMQFIFQFLQIFFAVAVIYFIGRMIAEDGKTNALKQYGADYFSFALVGLAINNYLRLGLVTITNDIRQVMNQGTLEAMCATPIDYSELLLYSSLWQFIFETFRVVCYFLVAILIFGMRLDKANWPAVFLVLILTIPIFLMLGLISCSILILAKKGDPINWAFSSLGALLAGTMFPLNILPAWLQNISFCLPLTHSIEAMRRTLLVGDSIYQIKGNILALLCFGMLLVPLTLIVNNVCMRIAKKRGAFSTF